MATKKSASEPVSFRLARPLHERLAGEAIARGIDSPDLYARALVVGVLQDETRLQLIEELHAVREDLRRLRADVATALEMTLINVGNAPTDRVQEFVSKNLRR